MIQQLLIQALLRQLLDPATRRALADAVAYVADTNISGAEKRAMALDMLREEGVQAANWVLNLGIELLVARLKS